MKWLLTYLAIGLAGFAGAVARFAITMAVGKWITSRFPLGTMLINVSGSFFLGWFLTVVREQYPVSDRMRLAIGAGFVGAYTTFSTLMVDTNGLAEDGAGVKATINLIGSLVLGILAVRFGIGFARRA